MEKNLLTGFSSCPNDTFMMDALINKRLPFGDPEAEPVIEDIEALNQRVLRGEADICKISFAVYPEVAENYQILTAGSALGFKNGPLLVSKYKIYPDELGDISIAIPGEHTTANLLLRVIFPAAVRKSVYLFSEIEEVVESGEKDAGLLIHESRFSYHRKGLRLISDLGEEWEKRFEVPVPLGCIVVRRGLSASLKKEINKRIRESVEFALQNPSASASYVKSYAQELDDDTIQKHIELYVNQFSVNTGDEGKRAIQLLFEKGVGEDSFPFREDFIFVE